MPKPPEPRPRRGPRRLTVRLAKADLGYQQLQAEILNGRLAPGTPLDQIALAMRIGLSTTPVREALGPLESERVVVDRAHHNTAVADLSPGLLLATYAVRRQLDPFAVFLAASGASDAVLATIVELAGHAPPADPVAVIEQNRAVHRAIEGVAYVAFGGIGPGSYERLQVFAASFLRTIIENPFLAMLLEGTSLNVDSAEQVVRDYTARRPLPPGVVRSMGICGSIDECFDQLHRFSEAGVDDGAVGIGGWNDEFAATDIATLGRASTSAAVAA